MLEGPKHPRVSSFNHDIQFTVSEAFFEIKFIFFGYFDPINDFFDRKNKYAPG